VSLEPRPLTPYNLVGAVVDQDAVSQQHFVAMKCK